MILMTRNEEKAIRRILSMLDNKDSGCIIASRIASVLNISASTIHNILSKLKYAGLINYRSRGRFGIYVEIIEHEKIREIIRYHNAEVQ